MLEKFKEVLYSVLPITVIVFILNFVPGALTTSQFIRFLVGSAMVILGLSIFLLGVDIGITPLGSQIGAVISRSNKLFFLIFGSFILGFFISIAEPDLRILANQVSGITTNSISAFSLLIVVSIGIAVLLTLGFIRVVYNMSIVMFLTIAYGIIFIITLFVPSEFIAIAFDASGATTGALAVPFILAMSLGISSLKKDSKASEEDSFGLVALVSTGAIMSVLIMGLIKDITNITGTPPKVFDDTGQIITPFLHSIPESFSDSFIAIAPICVIYIILQIFAFKFPRRVFAKIFKGLLYTMLGLTLFITGVNTGFMNVGTSLGQWIGQHKIFTVLLGLLIGVVTILAEPAVHVLTQQIETVTAGYVKRKIIMIALAIGVGIAVALSIIRILVPSLKLWHYLLPGYIVAIALSFAAPKLFVGIAFDSGGVASGPMTATFILAFSQGVASVSGSDLLNDAFGMIALVAMTPIIMIELVGLLYKLKTRKNLRGE